MGIAMGTTPQIKITVDELDWSKVDLESIKVYIVQGKITIIKTNEDMFFEEEKLCFHLTQEETLSFTPNRDVRIELRWRFIDELPDGSQKAGKTNIIDIPVVETLRKEVI